MKLPWPRSLSGRLVLALVVGLLAAQLLGAFILLQERLEAVYRASGLSAADRIVGLVPVIEATAVADRGRLAAALSYPPLAVTILDAPPAEPEDAGDVGALSAVLRVVLAQGLGPERQVVASVTDAPPRVGPPWADARPGWRMHGQGRHLMGPGRMALSSPGLSFVAGVRLADGSWVRFEQHLSEEEGGWPWRVVLALAVLVAAVAVSAVLAVRWLTQPLARLGEQAEQLGRNLRQAPLPETGPTEVARAAAALNTMQERLRRYVEDRTRILSALSHDLRTPLTRLRLRLESLPDRALREDMLRDVDELRQMAQGTLDFVRGLEDDEAVRPVDVGSLLESLRDDLADLGYVVELTGTALRPYAGRPIALKRCLANLLENAVKYGQRARVTVDDGPTELRILIDDDGPGIPDDALERVFDPFCRLESSRSRATGGTGLGLSIARNVARSHGGEIRLRNRPEGGLSATLALPR
jgi:signal transduction histidine kinase